MTQGILPWLRQRAAPARHFANGLAMLLFGALLMLATRAGADTVTDVTNIQAGARGTLYIGNQAPLQPSPLMRLPPGSIQPQGWLYTMLERQRNGLNGLEEQVSPFLQFATSDWTTTNGSGSTQGWERVPYWLRGYVDLGYCLQDATVMSNATRWIKGVMLSQRANGYFGPATDYGDATATSDLGVHAPDLWPAMPMLDAMRSYYEYTGDTNAMTLMRNYCLWENSQPATNFGAGYWPMMRMGDNIDSIYWLYNRLGESWLLNLATNMYANMARWDTPNTLPNWHNVNIAECFRAPTVFWQQAGNPTLLAFAEANYQVVKKEYGQVPGGAFGGDEICRSGYSGPRQAFETCGWVEFMRSFEILTRITGSPVWAERCEDVAANSYPAALTTNLMELHYLTAPNQPESDNENKSPDVNNAGTWFSFSPTEPNYYCCEHNHGMGWPYLCEETWLATWDNGLCASLYAPTTVRARAGDGSTISLAETTDYPFSDTVQLNLAATNSVAFPLYLRIPQWCSNSWIQVNGQTIATNNQPSSYVCLQRTWSNGDQVTLHFPRQVTVQTWTANNNCVSINYGPLTFSLQINEDWQPYGGNAAPWTELELYPASPWNYGLEINPTNPAASFAVLTNSGPMAAYPFSLSTAPIQLQAKARKIPAWTLDGLYAVGPVQPSPVYSTQAEETVTLVPMGAARARLAALPTVTTNAAATRWSAPYSPSASYTNSTDTVFALNDALEPANSSDQTIPRMTWWSHEGTAEWVCAAFNGLCQVSQVSVYWYDDTGIGQCRVPQSWYVQYLAGTNWVTVAGAGSYGAARNQFNTVSFNAVQTTAMRLMVQLQSGYSGGILEWQVPAEPVPSLAARYLLDSNLVDAVSGQNGVLNGGAFVPDRFGAPGRALQFSGTNSYATIPRPNWMDWTLAYWAKTTSSNGSAGKFGGTLYLNGTTTMTTLSGAFPGGVPTGNSAYTIAVWEKAGSGCPNNGGFVGWGNNTTAMANNLRLNGANSIVDYWWADDFTVTGLKTNPLDGNWHAVVVTWNGATETLYVDGANVATRTPTTPPNVQAANFIVGKTTGDVNFVGWLENLLIANRALNATEIANYQVGFSNAVIPSGTVGYWQFNNPTNLGADSSGWGNTLVSSAGNDSGSAQWWSGQGLVDGDVSGVADDFGTSLLGSTAAFGVGNPDTTIRSTNIIDDGQWHHIAATRSASTGLMQLYVDGALQASATGPFGPKTAPPSLRLGGIQSGGSAGFFAGAIDDVQIFNRVLSAPEVSAVMNQVLSLTPVASTTLTAGQTWAVTNAAVDPYAPAATLAWSLPTAPVGATIDPVAGVLTWRPTIQQSPSTNLISISVSDNGSPSLAATQNVFVTVLRPAAPTIIEPTLANGLLSFGISGALGPDYYVDSTTNLGASPVWTPTFTNYTPPSLPFSWTDTVSNIPQKFYRIRLGP
jgi:hypothetical protein